MKTFKNRAAQGDVYFQCVDALPKGLELAPIDNGKHIVAHSETGHHHVIDSRNAQLFIDKTNQFILYLKVLSPAQLEHLRSYDTHETLSFSPGIYRVARQREETPEGWRPTQD